MLSNLHRTMYYQTRNHRNSKKHANRENNPLIKVYDHTIEYCRKAKFPVYKPVVYRHDSDDFTDDKILPIVTSLTDPPMVLVENIDSFDMARKLDLLTDTDRILVLNLASDFRSGGGVKTGARAQEEDLYRKSNYFEANNPNFYPLRPNEVIYSPMVHIIKDSSYKLLDQPYPVACLAVAAIRNPRTTVVNGREIYQNVADADLMQNKIDMIFKVAIKHSHKDLVLGALGCGAFHNPPEEIALMFKKSLTKYAKYFRRIGFAILSPSGNNNFDIFHRILMD